MKFKITRASLLCMMATQALCAVAADTAPAVGEVNLKVSAQGGNIGGKDGSVADAALSLPLGHSFGAQIDASTGNYQNSSYGGVGLHLFARDPARGLIGLTGSNQSLGSLKQNRVGLEAESYYSTTTLRLRGGYQDGDTKNGQYGDISGRFYASENLVLSAGFGSNPNSSNVTMGVEWQPNLNSMPGLAVFANASTTSDNFTSSTLGVRYYFGSTKSLIKRHRNDDPDTLLLDGTSALAQAFIAARNTSPNCVYTTAVTAPICK